MTATTTETTARAERALQDALDELRSGADPILNVSLALALLRAEAGELPAAETADLLRVPVCTCPPELRARGGWRNACPVHGSGS